MPVEKKAKRVPFGNKKIHTKGTPLEECVGKGPFSPPQLNKALWAYYKKSEIYR
jgi:hypothetical protein